MCALSEYRGADPHHGCPFLDRDIEIVRHPHREVTTPQTSRLLRLQRVAEFAEFGEIRPDPLGIIKKRR